jgi:hypothetical protein
MSVLLFLPSRTDFSPSLAPFAVHAFMPLLPPFPLSIPASGQTTITLDCQCLVFLWKPLMNPHLLKAFQTCVFPLPSSIHHSPLLLQQHPQL